MPAGPRAERHSQSYRREGWRGQLRLGRRRATGSGAEAGANSDARRCLNTSFSPAISSAIPARSASLRRRPAVNSLRTIWSIDDTRSVISGSYGARSVQYQCDDEGRQQGIEANQDGGFDPVHRRSFRNNPCGDGKKGAGTGAWGLTHACSQVGTVSTNPRGGWLTVLTMIDCQLGMKTRNLRRASREVVCPHVSWCCGMMAQGSIGHCRATVPAQWRPQVSGKCIHGT